ncbi:MAG: NAD-dependent epimerase/dehydratase family protein [Verrucomicrobium sp.]|nr:NAD-dependent epimerase/dehydratase family protein [Verrucomicrobium sp.]
MSKTLILGCGYVGLALARLLKERGEAVTGWVHRPESARALEEAGIAAWTGDLADPEAWRGLPADFAAVVHCAATRGGGPEAYRRVYLEGMRRALAHLPHARPVMVSSTSVYGQNDGAWVAEDSPAAPAAATSQILLEAEAEALRRPGAVILRAAGIYGPGRGALLEKFRAGTAAIEGDGTRWINQIHRDDLAAALALPLPGGVYNAADDAPVTYLDYYGWLAHRLGKPMPPHVPPNPGRKRGLTNKRVSNARLRAAGWAPRHPTFREGLDALLKDA